MTVPDTADSMPYPTNHLWVDCQPDQTGDLTIGIHRLKKKEPKRIIGIVTLS